MTVSAVFPPEPETIAASIKDTITEDAAQGSKALIDFANRYAITPGLRHQALILRLEYLRADDESSRSKTATSMVELVEQILHDNRMRAGTEAAVKEQEARRKVREHFRAVEIPHDVVFSCQDLGKTYRKSSFSLAGVSLTLRRNEITGVVGQNAHGKTTLFRLIAGELRPDTGTLAFPMLDLADRNIDWTKVREHMAYVPQELPRWYGSLLANLQYEAALHGIRGHANREEVDFIVERLGLREHLDKRWSELSGGFKLRFSLARALVWKPRLLLLDEPLANLDFQAQLVVLRDLRDLAAGLRYPMAVLISSQHLHEIEAVADNILFLRQGQVVYNGSLEDLGDARHYNTFELGCDLTEKQLIARLDDFPFRELYYSGLSYVVTTPLEIRGNDLLTRLAEAGVTVEYFRDISGSIKQLFEPAS